MDIRPATQAEVDQLIAPAEPASQHHLRERWETQQRGDGVFLLAHRDGEIVGHTMLLNQSKYAEVRAAHDPVEINALDAYVPGQGIGTAIIRASEAIAADWSRSAIGMAVGADNPRARKLYERLGYQLWDGPQVIDTWTEQDAEGNIVRSHADPCDYLLKKLT
ncbi:acetyltransferase (GNAT) family protein [Kribbella steppae]|uniref:Acetyltransferase (GNAT) family protein n=1 Tax=Kribbella steppae TaxID=2512223 RepID=A0A4V2RZ13_9ACTN|nr:GNAT family N-acetyltransferase [Kribbella steppae]TCO23416.1 acetyltransferase (GNAT) family protein [Kribbella steppae]